MSAKRKPQKPAASTTPEPRLDLLLLGADTGSVRVHRDGDGMWNATISASWASGRIWAHDPSEDSREAALASLPTCVEQALRGYIEIMDENARGEREAARSAQERARKYEERAFELRTILGRAVAAASTSKRSEL